ncbi:MAG: hypothetical protein A3J38_07460 [Gammaproteobacteria bacterium RIFCSPHIGHO2_12_FULL_45_9]|nr:MAG: hypothetical protein A3J38_07460 [Gammaproteobacteria bacterium RIFCSPHIGHO2_12_FULL_45_9]
MIQYLLSCLAALFSMLMLIVLTLVSPVGLPVSLLVLKAVLPGKLTYTDVSGVIIDGLTFTHLRYNDADISLSVERLSWSWNLLSLMQRHVGLNDLSVKHATIRMKTVSAQHTWMLDDLNWPITLYAKHAYLTDIHWTPAHGTQPIVIQGLSAHDVTLGQQHLDGLLTLHLQKPYLLKSTLYLHGTLPNYHMIWTGKTPRFKWKVQGQGTPTVLNTHLHATPLAENKKTLLNGTSTLRLKPPYTGDTALVFQNATSNIHLTLAYDTAWHAHWNIHASALNTLFAHTTGHFHSSGSFDGSFTAFKSTGAASLQQLHLPIGKHNANIKTLKAQWKLNTFAETRDTAQSFTIQGDTLLWDRYLLPAIALKVQGPLSQHTLEGTLTLTRLTDWLVPTPQTHTLHLTVKAHGAFDPIKHTWQGTLSQFNTDTSSIGALTLQRPVTVSYSPDQIQLHTPACWSAVPGSLCVSGQYATLAPWHAELQWHNLVVSQLPLPRSLPLSGDARIQHTPDEIALQLSLHAATQNTLKLNMTAPLSVKSTRPIQGNLQLRTEDLRAFQSVIPPVVSVQGKLNADLMLSGQLSRPLVSGHLALQSGQVTIPIVKLTLTQLQATIRATKTDLLYETKALSGTKPLFLSGHTEWKNTIPVTTFTLRANEALLVNTPEYQIYGSPNLTLTLSEHTVTLKGDLFVPTAMLRPVDISNTVTLPTETEIIGDNTREPQESNWKLYQDVHLTLGNDVKIDAMGLHGQLHGALQLISAPNETPVANGSVGLTSGIYETYNRKLTIDDSSHISYLNSPIDNPTLNLRATRNVNTSPISDIMHTGVDQLAVGVDIQGTLDSPTFTLFSVPSTLSQADILSYLLFDQPSNANTPGNISLLVQALEQFRLGGMAPGGVSNEISQTLGITEFGVKSQAGMDIAGMPTSILGEQTSFVVGRYISSRIYIRYSRSLDQPINLFQMRYLFGKNWALQTESSSVGSGADLLFTWAH